MLVFFSIITVFTACWVKEREKFFNVYRFYRLLGKRKNDCLPCLLRMLVKFLIFIVFTICREKEKKSSFPVFTADVDKQK